MPARRATAGPPMPRDPDLAGFLALRGGDPAHVVKVALGEAAAALGEEPGEAPGLCLRLESALPIGAGFGSSAAAAVAVVAGYAVWRGNGDLDRRRRSRAWRSRRSAGSMGCPRESTPPPACGAACSGRGGCPPGRAASSTCEHLPTGSPLLGKLRVYHTGTPAEATGAVVAAVRTRRDRDPAAHERLFDRMAAAAEDLRAELGVCGSGGGGGGGDVGGGAAENAARVTAVIREHQACLEALGRGARRRCARWCGRSRPPAAPPRYRAPARSPAPAPARCWSIIADPQAVAAWEFLRPFPHLPVHLGAAGCRLETS